MVNNILKCGAMDKGSYGSKRWRVDMWMRVLGNHIFRRVGAIALTLGLLGCSTKDTGTDVKVASPEATTELIEFSIQGKPTKTIQTPWGPREIYDLANDRIVRLEIRKYVNSYLLDKSNSSYDLARQSIAIALLNQNKTIFVTGCKFIKRTNNCVSRIVGLESVSTCHSLNYNQDIGKMSTTINNTNYFENQYSFTGHFFSSEEFSLDEIFEFECVKWNEEF